MFITIEGIDGSGKSTQSQKLASWLEIYTHKKTIRTFEPGGYENGESLRKFILESTNYSAKSELLLFLADRMEHVQKVILPAINSGHNIICERWNESTLAYQSGGHNINLNEAEELINACNFPKPDMKIFLDISPEIALTRIKTRDNSNDKFENEGLILMKKVSGFYRKISESGKLIRINCDNLNEQQVFEELVRVVKEWQSR